MSEYDLDPSTAQGPGSLSARFCRIYREALHVSGRVDALGGHLKNLFTRRQGWMRDTPSLVEPRMRRGDEAFALANRCQALLEELDGMSACRRRTDLQRHLRQTVNRALRYNRESPLFLENAPVVAIPIDYNRNFLRDGTEHMYFLALHGLPSAYDLFCATYTETPRDYRQELHLHRRSEEVTLVLDGRADCVWYGEFEEAGRTRHREIGRISAGPLTAFRIPPKVIHTIHNPESTNANITVKLTMFIHDRVGKNDWEFEREPKSTDPVTPDPGREAVHGWGRALEFDHGYGGLSFSYRIDILHPHGTVETVSPKERFFFVFSDRVTVHSQNEPPIAIGERRILRIAAGLPVALMNTSDRDAILFSVQGLDYAEFLAAPERFPDYPTWFIRDFKWTVRPAARDTQR